MKLHYKKWMYKNAATTLAFLFLFAFGCFPVILQAQIVGSNGFMQGDYVEVGVNGCGAFASNATPPAGYVTTGLSGLNFIADSDMDGWAVGDPDYCGDYAMPGSPVEGWGIQIDGSSYYNTDQGCFTSDIAGDIISYEADGDSVVIVWEGEVAGVTINQRSVLYTGNLYFVTKVTLINTSGTDYTDIYYRRNIDPDNEQLWSGSFTTINTVEANPSLGDPYGIVTAVGETYGCYLAVVSNNLFASASRGNFSTTAGTSVSDSYNGLSGYELDGTITADAAIQMSFWVPSLSDGGVAQFAFAYVFSEDAVDDALADTYIVSDIATDVGVFDFDAPSNGCGLGSEPVTIKVINLGYEAQSDIPVNYQVDGGTIYTGTIAGPVEPGTIATYTFPDLADLSAIGDFVITAWTAQPGDEDESNDDATTTVTNIPVISSYPYLEDFEAGAAGWTADGVSSTWELGYPDGPIIMGPPPSTPSSENSWATSLVGYYNTYEDSYVLGPCFDFGPLTLPYVELDVWWETPDFWDGARLEYSLDAGGTWEVVGGIGTGDNWYTPGGCYSFGYDPITFTYRPAWEGTGGGWKTAYHDISYLAGESQVQFRIHFKSSFFTGYDGFAFDNFKISDPFPDDIGVTHVTSPVSALDLTASETITVEIENFGTNTQSGFPVSFQVDGGAIVTETFGGSIAAGEVAEFTFAATADMSSDGDYVICSWTGLETDEDLSNDSICKTVSNLGPITGTDAYYVYSNIYGGSEPWYTTSGSEAMDAVFTGGWNLAFFEELDPGTVFNSATCFVWLEGGDAMADELETFLTDNIDLVQGWVASGGHLILNSAPNEGDGMSFGFDGTELVYSWYSGTVDLYDAAHPIGAGPFTPVGTEWTGGSFGHASISGDFDTILIDAFTPDRVVLAEKNYGAGKVLFGGMTPTAFHSPYPDAVNLFNNILYYQSCLAEDACIPVSPTDIYVDEITSTSATVNYTQGDNSDGVRMALWNLSTGIIHKVTFEAGSSSAPIPGTLTPSTTYGVRLKTICLDEGMLSAFSDWYYFTTDPLREGQFDKTIAVYPNPNDGTFRIQLNGYNDAQVQVMITNTVGQQVYNKSTTLASDVEVIDISLQLASGAYFVKVLSGSEIQNSTIIIE